MRYVKIQKQIQKIQLGIQNAKSGDFTQKIKDDSLYTNFAHRPYFIEAIKGKAYTSNPYISSDTYNYCIAIAVPILVSGKIGGVLMADLHLG